MIAANVERARLLIEQNRFKEAEKELQKGLALEPNNTDVLYLLCICKTEEKNYKEAESLITTAIGIYPSNSFFIYMYSKILFYQDKYKEAEERIREAIQLDPEEADFFGLLAAIHLDQKNWADALKHANKGLELSPDNLTCLNIRSTALIKLDKKEDSYNTINEALNYDPENPITHSNLGWGLLEKGDHKKALQHFKKALETDPSLEYAKDGLVEALKARYWPYRLFLKYAFWINKMKNGAQWGVLMGFWIGYRVVWAVAKSNPGLKPFLMPFIFLYVLFAISTWIIAPISNLFLRLNVYGRYALSKKEIQTSNFVGVSLAIGLLAFLFNFVFNIEALFLLGILGVTMMIPLSSMLLSEKKNKRLILIGYTGLLGITGLAGITLVFLNSEAETAGVCGVVYLLGIMIYQWVANAVNSK